IVREVDQDNIVALGLELVSAVARTMGQEGKDLHQRAGNAIADAEPGLDGVSRRGDRARHKKPLGEALNTLKEVKLEEWVGTVYTDPTRTLHLAAASLAAIAAVDRAAAQQLVERPIFGARMIEGVVLGQTLLPQPNSLDDSLRFAHYLFSQ